MRKSRYILNLIEQEVENNTRKKEFIVKNERFTVRYNSFYLYILLASFLTCISIGFFFFLVPEDCLMYAILFWIPGGLGLSFSLALSSCYICVGEQKIVRVWFWIYRKSFVWNDICKALIKYDTYRQTSHTLFLKDSNGKNLFTVSSEMVGFEKFCRMVRKTVGHIST